MRKKPSKFLETCRCRIGDGASDKSYGNNGLFVVPVPGEDAVFCIIASDSMGWDHVSIHVEIATIENTPTWAEMSYVKNLFFQPGECVLQYHPAQADYVNCHPHTLHLWRPQNEVIPRPPRELV